MGQRHFAAGGSGGAGIPWCYAEGVVRCPVLALWDGVGSFLQAAL